MVSLECIWTAAESADSEHLVNNSVAYVDSLLQLLDTQQHSVTQHCALWLCISRVLTECHIYAGCCRELLQGGRVGRLLAHVLKEQDSDFEGVLVTECKLQCLRVCVRLFPSAFNPTIHHKCQVLCLTVMAQAAVTQSNILRLASHSLAALCFTGTQGEKGAAHLTKYSSLLSAVLCRVGTIIQQFDARLVQDYGLHSFLLDCGSDKEVCDLMALLSSALCGPEGVTAHSEYAQMVVLCHILSALCTMAASVTVTVHVTLPLSRLCNLLNMCLQLKQTAGVSVCTVQNVQEQVLVCMTNMVTVAGPLLTGFVDDLSSHVMNELQWNSSHNEQSLTLTKQIYNTLTTLAQTYAVNSALAQTIDRVWPVLQLHISCDQSATSNQCVSDVINGNTPIASRATEKRKNRKRKKQDEGSLEVLTHATDVQLARSQCINQSALRTAHELCALANQLLVTVLSKCGSHVTPAFRHELMLFAANAASKLYTQTNCANNYDDVHAYECIRLLKSCLLSSHGQCALPIELVRRVCVLGERLSESERTRAECSSTLSLIVCLTRPLVPVYQTAQQTILNQQLSKFKPVEVDEQSTDTHDLEQTDHAKNVPSKEPESESDESEHDEPAKLDEQTLSESNCMSINQIVTLSDDDQDQQTLHILKQPINKLQPAATVPLIAAAPIVVDLEEDTDTDDIVLDRTANQHPALHAVTVDKNQPTLASMIADFGN